MPHGSTITWRFKDSSTDGNFSGASYEEQAASSTVDCDPEVTATQAFGSCSSGSQTNTLTLTNAESATAYVKVEYKIDSGSYTTLNNNVSVSASSTDTSQSVAVPHGSTITWKITDSFTSADYTNMTAESEVTSSAADCDPDSTFSTAFGSCGSGAKTSTLTINNTESSDTVYYLSLIHI